MDDHLRILERRVKATGDPADEMALLVARARLEPLSLYRIKDANGLRVAFALDRRALAENERHDVRLRQESGDAQTLRQLQREWYRLHAIERLDAVRYFRAWMSDAQVTYPAELQFRAEGDTWLKLLVIQNPLGPVDWGLVEQRYESEIHPTDA